MIANILCVAAICLWAFYCIHFIVKSVRKSMETGVPSGCLGCESFKTGSCTHHCLSREDVDAMVNRAKETLSANSSKEKSCCAADAADAADVAVCVDVVNAAGIAGGEDSAPYPGDTASASKGDAL